jgi:CBS domain-containing protein
MITLQKLKVESAYNLDENDPILFKLSDEFSQVIKNFAHHAELRGIFVVDDENRFLGVLTRTDLLDWARVRLGAITLMPLTDMNKTIRLVTLIRASLVGDILRPETKGAAVRVDDTLAHALKAMVDTDLIVLPVVDDEQRVIGRLRLSEVLNLTLTES